MTPILMVRVACCVTKPARLSNRTRNTQHATCPSRLPLIRNLFTLGRLHGLFFRLLFFGRFGGLAKFEGAGEQASEKAAAHQRVAEEFKRGWVARSACCQRLNP